MASHRNVPLLWANRSSLSTVVNPSFPIWPLATFEQVAQSHLIRLLRKRSASAISARIKIGASNKNNRLEHWNVEGKKTSPFPHPKAQRICTRTSSVAAAFPPSHCLGLVDWGQREREITADQYYRRRDTWRVVGIIEPQQPHTVCFFVRLRLWDRCCHIWDRRQCCDNKSMFLQKI